MMQSYATFASQLIYKSKMLLTEFHNNDYEAGFDI